MGRSGSYLNNSITSAWSEHSLDPEDIRVSYPGAKASKRRFFCFLGGFFSWFGGSWCCF